MTTDEILTAVEPVIRYHADRLVKRLSPDSGLDADDLCQEARAAVVLSAGGYDPERSNPRTYFARRIHGAMVDAVRDASFAPRLAVQRGEPLAKVVSMTALNATRYDDDRWLTKGGSYLRFDPPHFDQEPADDAETEFLSVARRLCRGLSARERCVLRWYYCRGWTMRQIGERLGLSEARVSMVHSDLMDRAAGRPKRARPRAVSAAVAVPAALARRLAGFGLEGRDFEHRDRHWRAVAACPHCGSDREVSLPAVTNWERRGRVVPRCASCPTAAEVPA